MLIKQKIKQALQHHIYDKFGHPRARCQSNTETFSIHQFEGYLFLDAIICPNVAYLSAIFKKAARGNNNVVFYGQATEALNETINYCIKHQVSLYTVDMKRPPLITETQKDAIFFKTQKHKRYSVINNMFDEHTFDTRSTVDCAILDILDYITQYDMGGSKQNILIVQNCHKDECPQWVYDALCDITELNQFCYGSVLFIDSSFD